MSFDMSVSRAEGVCPVHVLLLDKGLLRSLAVLSFSLRGMVLVEVVRVVVDDDH